MEKIILGVSAVMIVSCIALLINKIAIKRTKTYKTFGRNSRFVAENEKGGLHE